MIEIKDLTKKYDNKAVLENINIKIPDGRIYGLAGQSGVGKSTLLRCINGLESFDSGSICIDATELNSLNEAEMREFRRSIGMIFQNFALLERKSVLENVMLPMEFWKYDRAHMEKRPRLYWREWDLERNLILCLQNFREVKSKGWRLPGPFPWTRKYCFAMKQHQLLTLQ